MFFKKYLNRKKREKELTGVVKEVLIYFENDPGNQLRAEHCKAELKRVIEEPDIFLHG